MSAIAGRSELASSVNFFRKRNMKEENALHFHGKAPHVDVVWCSVLSMQTHARARAPAHING